MWHFTLPEPDPFLWISFDLNPEPWRSLSFMLIRLMKRRNLSPAKTSFSRPPFKDLPSSSPEWTIYSKFHGWSLSPQWCHGWMSFHCPSLLQHMSRRRSPWNIDAFIDYRVRFFGNFQCLVMFNTLIHESPPTLEIWSHFIVKFFIVNHFIRKLSWFRSLHNVAWKCEPEFKNKIIWNSFRKEDIIIF